MGAHRLPSSMAEGLRANLQDRGADPADAGLGRAELAHAADRAQHGPERLPDPGRVAKDPLHRGRDRLLGRRDRGLHDAGLAQGRGQRHVPFQDPVARELRDPRPKPRPQLADEHRVPREVRVALQLQREHRAAAGPDVHGAVGGLGLRPVLGAAQGGVRGADVRGRAVGAEPAERPAKGVERAPVGLPEGERKVPGHQLRHRGHRGARGRLERVEPVRREPDRAARGRAPDGPEDPGARALDGAGEAARDLLPRHGERLREAEGDEVVGDVEVHGLSPDRGAPRVLEDLPALAAPGRVLAGVKLMLDGREEADRYARHRVDRDHGDHRHVHVQAGAQEGGVGHGLPVSDRGRVPADRGLAAVPHVHPRGPREGVLRRRVCPGSGPALAHDCQPDGRLEDKAEAEPAHAGMPHDCGAGHVEHRVLRKLHGPLRGDGEVDDGDRGSSDFDVDCIFLQCDVDLWHKLKPGAHVNGNPLEGNLGLFDAGCARHESSQITTVLGIPELLAVYKLQLVACDTPGSYLRLTIVGRLHLHPTVQAVAYSVEEKLAQESLDVEAVAG
mmetsp:Transcript_95545/g.270113  ORF Transcript_95545/g.270113 Transcript_95545/m.270113 type:complete len:559 (-) Transcript_95545:421-2097(-)